MRSLLCLIMLGLGLHANSAPYELDKAHMEIGFEIDHLMISSVKGRFDKFDGTFDFDEKTQTIKDLSVEIDMGSVNTANEDRDKHLKNADFFDVEKHPKMTFKADKASIKGKKGEIKGTLTIKGVEKPVTLKVEYRGSVVDPWGTQKVGFNATTQINRKDFGMTWNKPLDKAKGFAVGDMVKISIAGEGNMKK